MQFPKSDIRMYIGTWKLIVARQNLFDHQRLRVFEAYSTFFDSIFHRVVLPRLNIIARQVGIRLHAELFFGLKTVRPFIRPPNPRCGCLGHGRCYRWADSVSESPHLVGGNVTRDRSGALPLSAKMRLSVFFSKEKNETRFFASVLARILTYISKKRIGFTLFALTWKKNFSDYSSEFVKLTFGNNVNGNIKSKSHYHELTSSVK